MSFLHLQGGEEPPSGEVSVGLRKGWVKHFRVALSSAGAAAAVWALADLIERSPRESFALLQLWGPWPIVALVGLALLGRFMSRMNDTIQTSFASVVQSSQLNAEAQGRTADALTRLADQGGKQGEEVRRLAIYAAQEFPSVYDRFDKQDAALEKLASSVRAVHGRLGKMGHVGENEGGTNDVG